MDLENFIDCATQAIMKINNSKFKIDKEVNNNFLLYSDSEKISVEYERELIYTLIVSDYGLGTLVNKLFAFNNTQSLNEFSLKFPVERLSITNKKNNYVLEIFKTPEYGMFLEYYQEKQKNCESCELEKCSSCGLENMEVFGLFKDTYFSKFYEDEKNIKSYVSESIKLFNKYDSLININKYVVKNMNAKFIYADKKSNMLDLDSQEAFNDNFWPDSWEYIDFKDIDN